MRGKKVITTDPDAARPCPHGKVDGAFVADMANQLWATMLLNLRHMEGHGTGRSVKNGPALAGHGAEAVRDAIAVAISSLPAHLRRSLT